MELIVKLVRRTDGKMQLTEAGAKTLLRNHCCGICSHMVIDCDDIGRCDAHTKTADKWVVNPDCYGCKDFESRKNTKNTVLYYYE